MTDAPRMPTLALTVHPEWAAMIRLLDKRDENRTRPPPRAYVGSEQTLALHAGANIGGDRPAATLIQASWDRVICAARRAGHVALWHIPPTGRGTSLRWSVQIGDHTFNSDGSGTPLIRSAIVGVMRIESVTYLDVSAAEGWLEGPVGWRFRYWPATERPDGMPCTGSQGLWPIPAHIREWMRLDSYALPEDP